MKVKVKVPATSANLGSGFDVAGLALTLYNTFTFELSEDGLNIKGCPEQFCNENNLTYQAFKRAAEVCGLEYQGVNIECSGEVPYTRGLGSSSTCIVAGIVGAFAFKDKVEERQEILELATSIEGHPDNVAPAIYGNLCCATGLKTKVLNTVITVPSELHFAVVVPEVMVSTEYARSVLPNHVPFKEAAQNVSHASLFVTSLITHQLSNLSVALDDNLHVPYRKTLIPHCDEVFEAAKVAGAYGATISGSGSTLIAYVDKAHVQEVAKAMGAVFTANEIENKIYCLEADTTGALII